MTLDVLNRFALYYPLCLCVMPLISIHQLLNIENLGKWHYLVHQICEALGTNCPQSPKL